ncbi:hypothetical protein BH23VER1_BH23VER1_03310 [soil metagenome]
MTKRSGHRESRLIRGIVTTGIGRLRNLGGLHRIVSLIACLLLCACGDQSAHAPMLKLAVKGANANSVGSHRVFRTGIISESGDSDSSGRGTTQRITVDKIADDGVTLTIQVTDSSADSWERQIFVPYDEEITVDLPNDTTAIASLERNG